jgi:GGDEF domain-containing protein
LRTSFAAAFALPMMLGSALLSAAIGSRSSAEVRGGIGRSLAEVAYHMADKLDRGMWARSGEVAVLALDGSPARIGCSVGIAVWPDHDDDVHRVIRLADNALYSAKRAGKNRVVAHGAARVGAL